MRAKTNHRETRAFLRGTKHIKVMKISRFGPCTWSADCHGKVKLQIRVDDSGSVCINSIENQRNATYNHATISTLTV